MIWLAEDALVKGDVEEAIAFLLPITNSGDHLALRMLGAALAAQGDNDAAVQTWMQVADYQSLSSLARQAKSAGDMQTALQAYQTASEVDLKQGAVPFANFIGYTLKDQSSAINVLQLAFRTYQTAPQRNLWLRKLGDIFQQEERWQEAIANYQEALATNPKDFWAHIGLGRVYYKRGDGLEAASQEVLEAIELAPHEGLGYFVMGDILAREGQYSDADMWFLQAIQRDPENKIWRLVRANTIRTAGKLELALSLYQDTAARFPNWAPVYYEMAITFKLINNQQEAIENIERAITLIQPPIIGYYWRAGKIYEWAGNDERALEAYHSILLIDPTYVSALDAIQRLESNLDN